jgi:hypothetical protein
LFIPNPRDLAESSEDGIQHHHFDGLIRPSRHSPMSLENISGAFDNFGANALPCREELRHHRASYLRVIRRVVVPSPKLRGMGFYRVSKKSCR